jgi:hypothetical protein
MDSLKIRSVFIRQLRTCAVLLGIVFRSDNGCRHLNLFKRHVKGWLSSAKVLVASMLIYHYRRGDFIVSKKGVPAPWRYLVSPPMIR